MEQIKLMKHKLLSALMAALVLLSGGFVASATAVPNGVTGLATNALVVMPNTEKGQIAATSHDAGVIMLLMAKAGPADQEGLDQRSLGNDSWGDKVMVKDGSAADWEHLGKAGGQWVAHGSSRSIYKAMAVQVGDQINYSGKVESAII